MEEKNNSELTSAEFIKVIAAILKFSAVIVTVTVETGMVDTVTTILAGFGYCYHRLYCTQLI